MSTSSPKKTKTIIVTIVLCIAIVGLVAWLLIARQSNKPVARPQVQASTTASVRITEDGFIPTVLRVKKGSTIIWTNSDTSGHRVASNPYPVKSDAELDSKVNISTGMTYSHTFSNTGSYSYHDEVNPVYNAQIIVE